MPKEAIKAIGLITNMDSEIRRSYRLLKYMITFSKTIEEKNIACPDCGKKNSHINQCVVTQLREFMEGR